MGFLGSKRAREDSVFALGEMFLPWQRVIWFDRVREEFRSVRTIP